MLETKTKIQNFWDLTAWQEAKKLAVLVYEITKAFPREELYSLVDQIRRAVVSISANIAEGFGRETYKDKTHFYMMAQGSVYELQSHLIIAKELHYLQETKFQQVFDLSLKVHRILSGLIKKSRSIRDS
jgi:four helix bundle protein